MRWIGIPLLVAILLAGCQGPTHDLARTQGPPLLSAATAQAIAVDLVSRLAEQEAPASTTVHLADDRSAFALALERALTDWGYTVSRDPGSDKRTNAVSLSYSLTGFDGQILARLSMPKMSVGRVYKKSETGAEPDGPFSVQQID
ncbi:conjugal transfer protein TrbH [Rhizobium sp. KAs_5_22]|nr:conjugal transfer protein TrbH [Rhizobium sp. KAs_5_22]